MERVIAYVDGFNLYFGLKEAGYERYLWLDVHGLIRNLLNPVTQTLVRVNYFTSRVSDPPEKVARQGLYLEALMTVGPQLLLHYGHYLHSTRTCRECGHSYVVHSEKMTDVNIACELLQDAFHDSFDMALLLSADSDLSTPLTKTKALFPGKRVAVAFPPKRSSKNLRSIADGTLHIGRAVLAASQFPEVVPRADGFPLKRPATWV